MCKTVIVVLVKQCKILKTSQDGSNLLALYHSKLMFLPTSSADLAYVEMKDTQEALDINDKA